MAVVNKSVEQAIDLSFFKVLEAEGFARFHGEPLSYAKTSVDGKTRAHVDVEIRDYVGGFGVTLQDVAWDGTTRRQLLEDFRGLRAYELDEASPEKIGAAIEQALSDLREYGIPWFSGQTDFTPTKGRISELVADRRYRDAVRAAREEAKAGRFRRAAELYEEARVIRPLEPLDEKYRLLAERKMLE